MNSTTRLEPFARQWIEVVTGSPAAKALGIEIGTVRVDFVRLRLPYDDNHTTVPQTVHGGVIATLIDIAGAAASGSGITSNDGATGGATSHLSVTYLARASGDLCAEAKVVHGTRSMTHSEVAVRSDDDHLLATGQVSSRIFH